MESQTRARCPVFHDLLRAARYNRAILDLRAGQISRGRFHLGAHLRSFHDDRLRALRKVAAAFREGDARQDDATIVVARYRPEGGADGQTAARRARQSDIGDSAEEAGAGRRTATSSQTPTR